MVYVTGDTHGDLSRFKSWEFRAKLRRRDTLIICGDFGFIWDGSKKEKRALKWLGRRKYNILFVDGVHDNLSLLEQYPIAEWNGGKVREISGRLRYLCRGSILDIDGVKIFGFGGGENFNSDENEFYSDWWDKQLPSTEQLEFAKKNLQKVNKSVDYIVTHQSSRKLKKFMTMEDNEANVLDTFLDSVREECDYKGWFFGSFHQDKVIPPSEMAIFESLIPLKSDFSESVKDFLKKSRKKLKK